MCPLAAKTSMKQPQMRPAVQSAAVPHVNEDEKVAIPQKCYTHAMFSRQGLLRLLRVAIIATSAFFGAAQETHADSVLRQALPSTAPTSTLGTIRQIRVDPSDQSLYVLGSNLTRIGHISTDRSTYTDISYSIGLPNHSNSDLAISSGHAYIITSGVSNAIHRYDVTGGTAIFVASSTLASGTAGITLGGPGSLYASKGTNLYALDDDLNVLTQTSASTSIIRLGFGGDQLYYLSSTGRYTSSTPGVSESLIATGGPTSATAKGFTASQDGSALYYASTSGFGKISSMSGTTYWTESLSNIAGIDIDKATGKIYVIVTNGAVYEYSPIGPVTGFTSSASGTAVTLNWVTGVTDADFSGVTIRKSIAGYPTSPTDGVAVTSTNTGSSFTDTGLSEATYYYSIFAQTEDGYFSDAATSTATVDLPPDPPELSASASGNATTLTWSLPAGTDSFTLVRGTDGFPTSRGEGTVVTTTGSDVTGVSDAGLPDGTYYYSLFATDDTGNDSEPATSSVITIDTTAPEAPTLTASASGTSVSLSWNTPLSATTFRLLRSTTHHPTSTLDGTTVSSTAYTTFVDTGLADGTYYYSVFAADGYLNYSTAGTSTVSIDTVAPSTPSLFTAAASGNSVLLSWSNPLESDFSSSILRRSQTGYPTSTTDGVAVTDTDATSYTDASRSDGTYYYSLFAQDTSGNISTAATASVTIRTISAAAGGGASSFIAPSGAAPAGIAVFIEPSALQAAIGNHASPSAPPPAPNASDAPISSVPGLKAVKPSSTFTRILRLGDRGADVRSLQAFLNASGFRVAAQGPGSPGRETSFYGPATAQAVRRFQEAFKDLILGPYGLQAGTGILGPRMMLMLNGMRP